MNRDEGDGGVSTRGQIRGSTLLMLGRGLSLGLNFLAQVLAVRYLTKLDYGAFAYAFAAMELASRLALAGMDRAASRYTAIYHERRDVPRLLGSLVLMAATTVGVGLALIVATFGLRGLLGSTVVSNPQSLALLLILILLAPVEALSSLLQAVFAVFARARFIFFRRYIVGPGLKLAAVLIVIGVGGDVRMLASAYTVAGCLGLLVGIGLLRRLFAEAGLLGELRRSRIETPAREIFAYALPMMGSDVSFMLRSTLVVLMLEYFQGSVGVAEFRAVLPVARLNRSVIDSFGFLFMPMMARLLVREDARRVNELFWRSTLWISVLSFPGFAATCCLARPVTVLLFEERYAASAPVLALLSLGMFFSALIGLNATAMKAAGKVRQIVLLDATATLALFGLNLLLLPRFGALGGAAAFLTVTVAHTAAYQVLLARHTGVRLLPPECAAVFAAIAAAAGGLALVQWVWAPPLWVGLILVGLASAGVLAAAARLLAVEATFPELLRVPIVARLVRRLGHDKKTRTLANGS